MTSLAELSIPGRTCVMGIVNVTEDSFSDGGRYLDVEAALAHARELVVQGADIIDVGGESTRPGASRVEASVELHRVVPVIERLHSEGIRTSVDTMRAEVASAAAAAGVDLINDVSGGLADPQMLDVMAETGLPVCLMHWKAERFGNAAGAAHRPGEVCADVTAALREIVVRAERAGVASEAIAIDPGLGFAKTARDNWELLHHLEELIALGYPVLVGASRKRFLAAIRHRRGLDPHPDPATAAVSALAAQKGAWCVRVHDVASTRDAVDVARLWNDPAAACDDENMASESSVESEKTNG